MTEEEEHQLIRARALEEKNYTQAAKLMENEVDIKRLRRLYTNEKLNNTSRSVKMTIEEVDAEINADLRKSKLKVIPSPVVSIMSGGKDGEGNWLAGLKKGAVFHSVPKSDGGCDVEQWHIKSKWEKTTVLYSNFPQQRECFRLVDNLSFSRLNNLVELIREEEQELRYD